MKQIKAGLFQAVGLLIAGVAAGVVAGLLELSGGGTSDQMGATGAAVFPFLAILFPVWLILLNFTPADILLYKSLASALMVLLLAGLAGGVLGCFAFLVPATNLPVIFAGKNPSELSLAFQGNIGRGNFFLVVGVTTGAALLIGVWNYLRVRQSVTPTQRTDK